MHHFKICTILFLLLFSRPLFAQTVKTETAQSFEYELPPLNRQYLAYSNVFLTALTQSDFNHTQSVTNSINKNRYTLVNDRSLANLVISYGTYTLLSTPFSSTVEQTKTGYKYTAQSKHTVGANVQFSLPNGEIIEVFNHEVNVLVDGSSTQNEKEALRKYNRSYEKDIERERESALKKAFEKLEDKFLYASKSIELRAFEIKSKKHEYNDFTQASQLMGTWLKTNPTDLSNQEIIDAIQIFESLVGEYSSDKKARINTEVLAAVYYELAAIYFAIKDYISAYNYILKSEAVDNRLNSHQERLKDTCIELNNRLTFN